jgi:hypothetical protein
VAAQGGGIYAAIHTASILGGLQEQCPDFARHLFAISGVSGGSLGAAVFTGFLNHKKREVTGSATDCRPRPVPYGDSLVDVAEQVLYKDMLSPLLAGLLFPDFLQSVVPYPIALFDRARRFENAIEEIFGETISQWKNADGGAGNFMAERFRDHWQPAADAPALVFNTTEVGSGRRRVIAPFVFPGSDIAFLPLWGQFKSGSQAAEIGNLPVSAAAVLSARFPWITPAGSFYDFTRDPATGSPLLDREGDPILRKVRLVDGAYFENSGVATALDLVRSMKAAAVKYQFADKISIHLIVLTRGDYPQQTFFGLGEPVSPMQALLNTRTSRAYITIAGAERELKDAGAAVNAHGGPSTHVHKVYLRDMDYSPPLGWRLSTVTLLLILAQNGFPGECPTELPSARPKPRRFDADCLLNDVSSQLAAPAKIDAAAPAQALDR